MARTHRAPKTDKNPHQYVELDCLNCGAQMSEKEFNSHDGICLDCQEQLGY